MRRSLESRVIPFFLWSFIPISLLTLGTYIRGGPKTLEIFSVPFAGIDLSLALRLDALSSMMFVMVSVLAAIIGHYAAHYLSGEKRQSDFHRSLMMTVIPVFFLILSSNLIMFFLSWLGISWGLNRLLLFYAERPSAVLAARKKFLVSRLGDLFILGAIVLLYQVFQTFDFDTIFARAREEAHTFPLVHHRAMDIASLFLVIGAMTKSVQFPFHFWLPETMETPTPVSALMHAGVINAGGFLVIRLSEVISHGEGSGPLLAIVGAFTAVYGSLVMGTQNSIKSKLAYSTISQMGMMMFACGLGAFHFALFHIVAHSFYKAYAFLSTGGLVEEKKRLALSLTSLPLSTAMMLALACYGLVVGGLYWQEGAFLAQWTYLGVLALGICQSVQKGSLPLSNRWRFSLSILGLIVVAVGSYLVMEQFVSGFVAIEGDVKTPFWVATLTYGVFALGFFLSRGIMQGRGLFARGLYMTLWNDSYLASRTNRLVSRLWST